MAGGSTNPSSGGSPNNWRDNFDALLKTFGKVAGEAVKKTVEFGSAVKEGMGYTPSTPQSNQGGSQGSGGQQTPPSRSQQSGEWVGRKLSDFLDKIRGNAPGTGAAARGAASGGKPGLLGAATDLWKNNDLKSLGGMVGALGKNAGWLAAAGSALLPMISSALPGADTFTGAMLRHYGPQFAVGGLNRLTGGASQPLGMAMKGVFRGMQAYGAVRASGAAFGQAALSGASGDNMGALSGGIRSVGAVGGFAATMMGGPIAGLVVNKMTNFVAGLVDSVKKLREWTGELHKANMQFAEFSSSMARVQAEQEMRDMQYSIERGEARATSADFLARKNSQFDREWAWVGDTMGVAGNIVGGFALDHVTRTMKGLSMLVNPILGMTVAIRDIKSMVVSNSPAAEQFFDRASSWFERMQAKFLGGDKDEMEGTLGGMFDQIAQKHWAEVFGRPAPWKE